MSWPGRLLAALSLGLWSLLAGAAQNIESGNWDPDYDQYFQKYAARYFGPHFDWRWFKAQAIAESHLRPSVTSSAGARGIMQLLPSTFRDIKRKQPHLGDLSSAEWNIAAGIYYDRQLYRKWQGLPEQERVYLTLASYNAGYARVRRAFNRVDSKAPSWDQVRQYLPAETRAYVDRIRRLMDQERAGPRMERLAYLFDA
jgi:membrane-bound lytic murein transglycosylase F